MREGSRNGIDEIIGSRVRHFQALMQQVKTSLGKVKNDGLKGRNDDAALLLNTIPAINFAVFSTFRVKHFNYIDGSD